jgi:anti-sigma factor RsiW
MECRIVREMLSPYVDDELDQGKKRAVDLHLRDCPSCREEVEELLVVHRLFADAERFTAPFGFSTKVLAHTREGERKIRSAFFSRPFFLRTIEIAIALVVLIVGALLGNLLTATRQPDLTSAEMRLSFALDTFEAAPSGSIGSAYVALTEVKR